MAFCVLLFSFGLIIKGLLYFLVASTSVKSKLSNLSILKTNDKGVYYTSNKYAFTAYSVIESLDDIECKILGALHDVIEDCDIDEEGLIEAGIPEYLVRKLPLLSKKKGEKYFDYILRAKSDELTRKVKLADLKDNMDLSRLYPDIDKSKCYDTTYLKVYLKEKDFKRYEKYLIATEMLNK